MSAEPPCPLCGEPLYAWVALPKSAAEATVGLPRRDVEERVLGRCENCGTALEREVEVDLESEWEAIRVADERRVAAPNRASLQAALGLEGWTAISASPGNLLLTPRGLELLAQRTGHGIEAVRTPLSGKAQAWMWQTLLNGLTFHPNFFRDVRAGRLGPSNARSKPAFVADAIVTILGGPLTLLVSLPLELLATLFRRGGELSARAPG